MSILKSVCCLKGVDHTFAVLYEKAVHHAYQHYPAQSPVMTFDQAKWRTLLEVQEAQEAKDEEAMNMRYEKLREVHRFGPLVKQLVPEE